MIHLHDEIENGQAVTLQKRANGADATLLGAVEWGTVLSFSLTVPRRMGAAAAVLRIAPDGGETQDLPLTFTGRAESLDTYTLDLDTAALCGARGSGLFYYEFLLVRGWDTLFSQTVNNADITFDTESRDKFRLLVYEKGYDTPAWFRGATMYHIFLDRFFCGEGETDLHGDAQINPDWHHGIPQYARKNGDALANNVFFGGNLWGVAQKLDYLASLGVTVLYLSPVFKAYSNHRYDTGDYERIDSILGGEAAFDHLIKEAHARGMRVILDGVFNHTGDDSRYFNRRGSYEEVGAYQSPSSPYFKWFSFRSYPDSYDCWWNIEILPRLNHANEDCRHYFTAPGGIVERWLKRGADGWRLDVADELSDDFLDEMRQTAKEATGGEALIIGEVWENAADKIAYGKRRRYFGGRQLDSVMNYPFRNAALALIKDGDAETFYHILTEIYASYPRAVCHSLMNLLGTHDTERILTVLGDHGAGEELCNDELAHLRLDPKAKAEAVERLKLAAALQFTVFGVPSVYYGDEAGLQGYHDPFCRMPFPWGEEDEELQAHYRALGNLRRMHPCLATGEFRFLEHGNDSIAYERARDGDRLIVLASMGEAHTFSLGRRYKNALSGEELPTKITLRRGEYVILDAGK